MNFIYWKRKFIDKFMQVLIVVFAVLAIVPLLSLVSYVFEQGGSAITFEFFTELPKPIGEEGGGLAHALWGSLVVVSIAALVGIPWGLACGIYLSEYKHTRLARNLRFTTDLMTSIPSIIIGLFAYAVLVKPMQGFSALAGALALSIIMIPAIARSTEEILRLTPDHIREAGLALGLPRYRVILNVVLRGATGGVVTGVMLAVARVSGETAPLLFTAFGSQHWSTSIFEPIATLPVQIYVQAISPFEDWHRQAWGAALILVFFVLIMNLLTRFVLMRAMRKTR